MDFNKWLGLIFVFFFSISGICRGAGGKGEGVDVNMNKTVEDLHEAIRDFADRERRFGGLNQGSTGR